MKLLILRFSPAFYYFFRNLSKYSQHPVLKNHSLFSSLNVRDQISCPYKITGKIIVVYFNCYIVRQQMGRQGSELNGSKHYPNFICF
jgi:hypothetical protein